MKTKLLLLSAVSLLIAIIPGNSFGHSRDSLPKPGRTFGGIGFFTPGIHTIQYSKLNSSLPAGYPQLTNKPFVTSGIGYGIISNIVIGGEGGTIHAGSFTKGNQQVDLAGDFGFFTLGYVVLNKKGILLFPTVSIGSNDLMMYIHEKDQTSSFGSITGEPFQATTLHYSTKMAKFSLTGVYALAGSKSDRGAAGLMLGLQVGYQMGYAKGVWTYDGGTVTDGPDYKSNGLFVQLMIGGGGAMRK
jgi:hypothetical protein